MQLLVAQLCGDAVQQEAQAQRELRINRLPRRLGQPGRQQWQASPDTEEVRQHLLELARAISEQPVEEYPAGMYTDELVYSDPPLRRFQGGGMRHTVMSIEKCFTTSEVMARASQNVEPWNPGACRRR